MRVARNGAMQGTRVGAGPAGEPYDRGFTVAKVVVFYHCANKHQTLVPFSWTASPPPMRQAKNFSPKPRGESSQPVQLELERQQQRVVPERHGHRRDVVLGRGAAHTRRLPRPRGLEA